MRVSELIDRLKELPPDAVVRAFDAGDDQYAAHYRDLDGVLLRTEGLSKPSWVELEFN